MGFSIFYRSYRFFLLSELFKEVAALIIHAQPEHLPDIDRIYNQAIEDGLRTAHLEPLTHKEREDWLKSHSDESFPVFIWTEHESVLGWLSISPYRSGRGALSEVAEVSYYVDYNHHGKGIATALMEHAIDFCTRSHFRILVAILVSENIESIALLQKFGFEEAGRVRDAIHYRHIFRDHVYMSLKIK